jgi:hypothetical protein
MQSENTYDLNVDNREKYGSQGINGYLPWADLVIRF